MEGSQTLPDFRRRPAEVWEANLLVAQHGLGGEIQVPTQELVELACAQLEVGGYIGCCCEVIIKGGVERESCGVKPKL